MEALMFYKYTLPVLLACCSTHIRAQISTSNVQAMHVIKDFYGIYINEISGTKPPNGKKMDSIQKKYCTIRFLQIINNQELDEDPFIKAQDSDSSWVKTLSVSKDAGTANTYVVSYIDKTSGHKTTMRVFLLKSKDGYKIDNIW